MIGAPSRHQFGGGDKRPRSYSQLEAAGLLAPAADPWRYLDRPRSSGERGVAEWLRTMGVEVRSVSVDAYRTPDAVLDVARVTVEFKTVGTNVVDPAEALYQRIRHGRTQSTRVVGDVRDTGATRNQVNRAIVRALRNGGRDLSEIVVAGDGFAISWP